MPEIPKIKIPGLPDQKIVIYTQGNISSSTPGVTIVKGLPNK